MRRSNRDHYAASGPTNGSCQTALLKGLHLGTGQVAAPLSDFPGMSEENTNKEIPEDRAHCDICREIRMGCAADNSGETCSMCNRKGYLDLGDGRALVCSACQRGFRLKLWLKHQELAENHSLEFLLELPVFVNSERESTNQMNYSMYVDS